MSANLDITQVSASQNQKEVTINDAIGALDAALTEGLTVDFTSGNVTLTDAQFRGNIAFIASNMAAGRTLTVPEIKRLFIVNNPDASESLDVIRGTTTITVDTETTTLFYTDGTANGLLSIAGGGGGGGDFVSLTDTPANFSGHGGKVVGVNSGETAIEFVAAFARAFLDLNDVPSSFTGQGGRALRVNTGEDALIFDNYPTSQTNWLTPFKGALVSRSTDLTGITLPEYVDWDNEVYDTDDFYDSGDPSRLTIPSGVTKVRLVASIETTADAGAGMMFVSFHKDGNEVFSGLTTVRNNSTGGFNNNSATCVSPVLEVTAGEYFEVRFNVNGLGSADDVLSTNRSFFALEVVETTAAEEPAVMVGSYVDGSPSADEKVLRAIVTQDSTLAVDADGSFASADTAANASADFDLLKNGVSIGTINWAGAATDATFTVASATDFDAGDVISIEAPSSPDSTLADLSFALKLTLRAV